jgi:hypothetical protein
MIRRRLAALAFAAGCLLSQTGCAGLFGNNNSSSTGSTCCLGGLFSRWTGSSSNACAPACVPASTCGSTPIMAGYPTTSFDAVGGGGGCGCNRDPYQFTGMQGAPVMSTIPGGFSQGAPINVGPDMGAPMIQPSPMPSPPNVGPRIQPVPAMGPPVPAGAYQQWTPGAH